MGFPDFGGEGAAHRSGILTRLGQARGDRRWIAAVAHHEVEHIALGQLVVFGVECRLQFGDSEQGAPTAHGSFFGLRHQGSLHVDVEHARSVFGTLGIACHPEQVICGSA